MVLSSSILYHYLISGNVISKKLLFRFFLQSHEHFHCFLTIGRATVSTDSRTRSDVILGISRIERRFTPINPTTSEFWFHVTSLASITNGIYWTHNGPYSSCYDENTKSILKSTNTEIKCLIKVFVAYYFKKSSINLDDLKKYNAFLCIKQKWSQILILNKPKSIG